MQTTRRIRRGRRSHLYNPVASGTVTLANAKKSLVAGTAFIDTAVDLSAYASADSATLHPYWFKLIDSSGLVAWGYIGASGGGEAVGAEKLSNTTFDVNTTSWSPVNTGTIASVAGGQSNNCLQVDEDNTAANPGAYQDAITVIGTVYKYSVYVKQGTEATYEIKASNTDWSFPTTYGTFEATGSWVLRTLYHTAVATTTRALLQQRAAKGSGTTMLFDEALFKPLTDCSTNGLHILSTKDGSTQNWADVESGFDYNDSSNYTYEIYDYIKGLQS